MESKVKQKKISLKIKELRFSISDNCFYSCRYCNLYYEKKYKLGLISNNDFLKEYKVGNESYGSLFQGVKSSEKKNIFLLGDYKFIFLNLKRYFDLKDVTFTGWKVPISLDTILARFLIKPAVNNRRHF